MASNGGGNINRSGGASISAAATAIGTAEARFPPPQERRRWGGCWGGFSCFGSQKGGKRIVPASRIPDGNSNGPQPVGLSNQTITLTLSLLAPPSSPASFTNSALPSTAQSPSCFLSLSANSPGGPSTMFTTGPYAHETQLVSPPVFSTFTTEPSTAPLTPPPELAHPTTPSSPDVPFAQFLSSSMDLKNTGKENGMPFMSARYGTTSDLQATYPLYPGSPASSLLSPVSGTFSDGKSSPFPERDFPKNSSSKLFGLDNATSRNFMLSPDCSFFCPATSPQFYLDQAQQSYSSYPHCGGRLSLSREADAYSNGGNAYQNRQNKTCKTDVDEIEAYRASFGFSADEIISTPHYVEISDVLEDSFTMIPFASNKPRMEECAMSEMPNGGEKMRMAQPNLLDPKGMISALNHIVKGSEGKVQENNYCDGTSDPVSCKPSGNVFVSKDPNDHVQNSEDQLIAKVGNIKVGKRNRSSGIISVSDAEVDYRRGRSINERNGDLAWC
ncbi:uncharacterized protein At1g76660-like isoform X2 [Tasmannia lanceolata]|uniref:uncharacterized protein At1g76660-like isoform X2 n=1 Tax=Tasmannia lanceolata TaxID=3420 RepID=UPI004062EBDB